MNEVRVYHPPNWKPLERWLSASFCRREFDWMWRDEHLECYRCRNSGELLYLDPLGQCFDLTEVGALPADFRQRFERCTGRVYNRQQPALANSEDFEEEGEEEDGPGTLLPADHSLSRIVGEWAAESKVDSVGTGYFSRHFLFGTGAAMLETIERDPVLAAIAVNGHSSPPPAPKKHGGRDRQPLDDRGISLPEELRLALRNVRISAWRSVSVARQTAGYVVRGTESGGAVAQIGH